MKHVKLFENFDKLNEDVYIVMNRTDGFSASPDVMTSDEADKFIKEFPLRFKAQGYYLTKNRERIDPMDVELEKVPVEGEDPEFGTKYEAMENITMRGFIGNFKLQSGEVITIEEGRMPKNYKVKMPNGSITEISHSNIQDLIALGRLQPIDEEIDEDIDESENANDMWLSIITKFYNEFLSEYPEDDTPEDFVNDREIESNQTKDKRDPGARYDHDVPFEDALYAFKKSLTPAEATMIEISKGDEEYADVEDHDTDREFTTVKIKRK